jgi:putative transcriptional regulator
MNPVKAIRERLGLTQSALAAAMGCTQGNVGHYERGQTVPPDAAKKLIALAKAKGETVTYEDIYGTPEPLKARRKPAKRQRPVAAA